MGIAEMLKHGLAHNGIECVISKRQAGSRTHDIRPLVLHRIKIDDVGSEQRPRRVSGPKVEYEPIYMAIQQIQYIRRIGVRTGLFAQMQAGHAVPAQEMRYATAQTSSDFTVAAS